MSVPPEPGPTAAALLNALQRDRDRTAAALEHGLRNLDQLDDDLRRLSLLLGIDQTPTPRRPGGQYKPIPDDTRSKIRRLYMARAKPEVRDIARRVGLSRYLVGRVLEEEGLPLPQRGK